MQSMYSFLALPGWLSGNAIVIAAIAAVALIAVIVGAVRGFTRIGWGALFWGLACGLFWVLDSRLHDSNPLLKLGAVSRLEEGVRDFIASMSWALVAHFGVSRRVRAVFSHLPFPPQGGAARRTRGRR